MDDPSLKELVRLTRLRIAWAGPLSPLWDVIADAEELMADRPENVRMSRDEIARTLRNFIIQQGVERARGGVRG